MAYYFTREEAEALLPAITTVLLKIQELRRKIRGVEEELEALQLQAMGNGHHLHERAASLQANRNTSVEDLRATVNDLYTYGCELKDADTGLIDFLSLRNGEEVYLCWRLGEERIKYWHYLDTGFSGRQPL